MRVDVLMSLGDLPFTGAYDRRIIIEVDGLMIPILSKDDLIASKLAAGRPQDLIDVDLLRRSPSP